MELLDGEVAKSVTNEAGNVGRFADAWRSGACLACESTGEFKRGEEAGGLRLAHAGGLHQFGAGPCCESAQPAIGGVQQLFGGGERVLFTGAGAEEDGEEFADIEGGGAEAPEAFAGAVMIGEEGGHAARWRRGCAGNGANERTGWRDGALAAPVVLHATKLSVGQRWNMKLRAMLPEPRYECSRLHPLLEGGDSLLAQAAIVLDSEGGQSFDQGFRDSDQLQGGHHSSSGRRRGVRVARHNER